MKTLLALIVALVPFLNVRGAPVFYSGGTYFQDFSVLQNSAPSTNYNTFPDGWALLAESRYRWTNGGAGLSSGINYYSFSNTINVSDKALGLITNTLQGGNYPNTAPYFTFSIQNLTQTTYTDLAISFTGEQWKEGAVTDSPSTLSLYINGVEVPSLAFVSPHSGDGTSRALDGNLAENSQFLSTTVSGLDWKAGDTLVFKWSMPVASSISAAHGLAIDDFTLIPVPEPSTLMLLFITAFAAGVIRMRKRGEQGAAANP